MRKTLKKFTVRNLNKDRACPEGMDFVRPLIKEGKDVAMALYKAKQYEWLEWAVTMGYDVRHLGRGRIRRIADKNDYISTCDCSVCSGFTALLKKEPTDV